MKKTDAELKQAVSHELKWDTRVNETEIGVAVSSGIVTLTGTVSSWGMRSAAEKAAHRVGGVLDVANDIEVKVPGSAGRTDAQIARAVRDALEWNVFVPDTRIRSTVSDGWVTLEGDVDNHNERTDAQRAVRDLAGVRGVTNQIQVKPPTVGPGDVRQALQDALARHAAREAAHIAIEVKDGRVSLSGIVHSWPEKDAAIGAAKATPGVSEVLDRIHVQPYAA
jgi:osmotically-inducible protein OsmY